MNAIIRRAVSMTLLMVLLSTTIGIGGRETGSASGIVYVRDKPYNCSAALSGTAEKAYVTTYCMAQTDRYGYCAVVFDTDIFGYDSASNGGWTYNGMGTINVAYVYPRYPANTIGINRISGSAKVAGSTTWVCSL